MLARYCPQCRTYVDYKDVRTKDLEEIHFPRCGGPVFDCTEEEYWGVEESEVLDGSDLMRVVSETREVWNEKGINPREVEGCNVSS
jgi:hypothetical protein